MTKRYYLSPFMKVNRDILFLKVLAILIVMKRLEAWIDYLPSQGAVHKQGDTWVPLDASFKQYGYTQGIDTKTAVPFNAQAFVDQIQATATINETEGYANNESQITTGELL